MGARRWRWDQWLVAGPAGGGLVFGLLAPALLLVDSWVIESTPSTPGWSYDFGAAAVIAAGASILGAMAGLAAGVVCALVTVLVEWIGRPSRRFYTWLAVGVTVVLATPVGVFGHGANSGFDLVLFPIVPICASSFAAYWVGAWVWSKG